METSHKSPRTEKPPEALCSKQPIPVLLGVHVCNTHTQERVKHQPEDKGYCWGPTAGPEGLVDVLP